MPVGPYETFDDCVDGVMSKEGYDEETARKVCGKMEQESNAKAKSASVFRMRAGDELAIDLYDNIGADPLFGGGISAKQVLEQLKTAPKAKSTLVRINSAGGFVTEGLSIYNLLNERDGVTTRCDSLAGSIASIIFMAGSKREMAPASMLMIHNPYGMVEGDADELRSTADRLEMMRGLMLDIYCGKTGLPRDVVGRMMDDEKWMDATEARQLGFATDIIEEPKAKLAAHFDLSQFRNTPSAFKAKAPCGCKGATKARAEVAEAIVEILESGSLDQAPPVAEADTLAASAALTNENKMTEAEFTEKLAALEATVGQLKAELEDAKTAKAKAEADAKDASEALAKAKKAAADDGDDDEDEDDMAKAAVVSEAMEATGCKDLAKLPGAIAALAVRMKSSGVKDAHSARVKALLDQGKLPPHLKARALKWSPAQLDGFIEATGGEKFAPVGEEHEPDDNHEKVKAARASGSAPQFNADAITLDSSELAVIKQMGATDTGLRDRMLAEKRERAKAEHIKKYGTAA